MAIMSRHTRVGSTTMLEGQVVWDRNAHRSTTYSTASADGDTIRMMKLTTLWSFDRTVDPGTGRSPIADRIAANWVHDPGTVRFFRSSANFIYTLERAGRLAYLRIAATAERSLPVITAELDLLSRLHRDGILVVQPIASTTGRQVVTQETDVGSFHAVLFDRLDGRQRELEDLSLADFELWGATVGRLHAALAIASPNAIDCDPAWQSALDRFDSGMSSVPDAVHREGHRLRDVLARIPRTPDTYGLLHNDLELDNLVWDGDIISVLDFDECGSGWYGLDIAKALLDLMMDGDGVDSPRIAAFLAGYRRHHVLDDDVLEILPDFLALSRFRQYISLDRALDIEEHDAEIDWLRTLIHHLRAWMDAYERGLAVATA